MGTNLKAKVKMADERRVKGCTRGVYIDVVKLEKLAKKFSSQREFADTIGRSSAWYWNAIQTGRMSKVDAVAIKGLHKIDLIIPKPEPIEEKKEEAKPIVVDNKDVVEKLDEVLVAINKLGNVNMQILENLHKITKELVK